MRPQRNWKKTLPRQQQHVYKGVVKGKRTDKDNKEAGNRKLRNAVKIKSKITREKSNKIK